MKALCIYPLCTMLTLINKLLAFDFGRVRIGIAAGQTITKTSMPIATVKAKRGSPKKWEEVDKIIKEWCPDTIIVGLPIDTKGQETYITKEARHFSCKIKERYRLPVHLIQETFSTCAARWYEEKVPGKKIHSHYSLDAVSACIILETWMNK